MPLAGYFFIAGVVLGGICGLRISVRVVQWIDAMRRWDRPSWDPTHLILRVQLRNTFALEIIGFVIAQITVAVADRFLKPV